MQIMRAGIALGCLFAALPAAPRDSSEGVALPGAATDPRGCATPASSRVAITDTTLVLGIRLTAGTDIPGIIVMSPAFGPAAADEPYPDRQFPELELRVDGAPVQPAEVVAAFRSDRNIIGLIRQAQLDPWAITHVPPLTAAADTHGAAISALTREGAIQKSGDGYLANWTASRTLRAALRPGAVQELEIRYTARPAFVPVTIATVATPARERDYCLADKSLRRLLRDRRATQPLVAYQYTIPTGIDDVAPAAVTFELTPGAADAAAQHDPIFLCGPHRQPIAATGIVRRQPAGVDENGVLRVLRIGAARDAPR
jgi:hypothetical protein